MILHRTSHNETPFVKYNRVISPGISHVARESFIAEYNLVETAQKVIMATFMHAIKNVSLIENTNQTFIL